MRPAALFLFFLIYHLTFIRHTFCRHSGQRGTITYRIGATQQVNIVETACQGFVLRTAFLVISKQTLTLGLPGEEGLATGDQEARLFLEKWPSIAQAPVMLQIHVLSHVFSLGNMSYICLRS